MITGAVKVTKDKCDRCDTTIVYILADGDKMCLNGHVK